MNYTSTLSELTNELTTLEGRAVKLKAAMTALQALTVTIVSSAPSIVPAVASVEATRPSDLIETAVRKPFPTSPVQQPTQTKRPTVENLMPYVPVGKPSVAISYRKIAEYAGFGGKEMLGAVHHILVRNNSVFSYVPNGPQPKFYRREATLPPNALTHIVESAAAMNQQTGTVDQSDFR